MSQEFDVSPAPQSEEELGPVAHDTAEAGAAAPADESAHSFAPAASTVGDVTTPADVDGGEHATTAPTTNVPARAVAADAPPATDMPPATADTAAEATVSESSPAVMAAAAAGETASAAAGTPESAPAVPALRAGDRVRARIVHIGDEYTDVEIPGAPAARIRSAELRDREGGVLLRENDRFTATIASVGDVITLSLGKKRGVLDAARLRLALEQRTTVTGTVQAMNKGGFEVRIGRVRAFCPLSQIDAAFVEIPESYMGKSLTFRVLRWENHGRNIVVSRRSVLRDEAKAQLQELRKQLSEGAEMNGVVKRLQPFGAFVDLGGIEGLLHVSRMGYSRVDDPAAVVTVGATIRVRVVKIEHPGTRRERIALALADLGPDPWAQAQEQLHVGDVLTGTVVRLAPFGAFVRLPIGLDGLVHLSELSNDRVSEPQEVVSAGQEVQVRVLHVDVEKRRISLSLRRASDTPEPLPRRREPRRERPPRQRDKTPSPASGNVTLTHTMADQLGLLKQKFRGHA